MVEIAVGCQVIVHRNFWSKVFDIWDIGMEPNLLSHLSQRDKQKKKKTKRQSAIEGDKECCQKKHEKINKEHKAYTDGHKADL